MMTKIIADRHELFSDSKLKNEQILHAWLTDSMITAPERDLRQRISKKMTVTQNGIEVMADLELLKDPNLTALPDNLHVNGDLNLYPSSLTALPNNMHVAGLLIFFRSTCLITVGANLHVNGNLGFFHCTSLSTFGANLQVDGDLGFYACTSQFSLGTNLLVRGYLQIIGCPRLALPTDLHVGKRVLVFPAEDKPKDPKILLELLRPLRPAAPPRPVPVSALEAALDMWGSDITAFNSMGPEYQNILSTYLTRLHNKPKAKRRGFAERVRAFLDHMRKDASFCEEAMIQIRQELENRSDQLIDDFSQMEIATELHRIQNQTYPDLGAKGAALREFGKSLKRLDLVQKFSREKLEELKQKNYCFDPVEFDLFYQFSLEFACDLPIKTHAMSVAVFPVDFVPGTENDFLIARVRVNAIRESEYTAYLSSWAPWQSYLRECQAAGIKCE